MFQRVMPGFIGVFDTRRYVGKHETGGAGGIRTLDRALQPYNGLANRRLQPLGHSSVRADMPDAGAGRKRQIRGFRIRRYLRALARPGSLASDRRHRSVVRTSQTRRRFDNHCLRESRARLITRRSGRARCFISIAQFAKTPCRKLGLMLRAASAISAPSRQQDFVLSLPDKGFCKLIRAAGAWVPKVGQVIPARNHRPLRPIK